MAARFCIPQTVALPSPATLAKLLQPSGESTGKDELDGLNTGDLVHITGGTPDGTSLYAVAAEPSPHSSPSKPARLRDGWLESSIVKPLPPSESASAARLPLRELLKRVTLARAEEDWLGLDDPVTLFPAFHAGELLQLAAVQDSWAYGWCLRQRSRRGWFPVALVQRLEPSASSLATAEDGEELSERSAGALLDLLRQAERPPPNVLSAACPRELPPAVAASAREQQQLWEDKFEEIDAKAASEAAALRANQEQPSQAEDAEVFPAPGAIPDDSFPLFVCKSPFKQGGSGANTNKALLTLEVGDLIRVVSVLEAAMYCGFHEDRPSKRGWFPRRCVEQLEDPLGTNGDVVPVGGLGLGPPPLPQVPHALLLRGAR